MSSATTAAIIAVTAITAYSQMEQGKQAQEGYNAQAEQAELEGVTAKADAMSRAERIRKLGKRQVGETNAQLAASGVKLGEGTALELEQTITSEYENDAFNEVLTGSRALQSATTSATSMRMAGRNAKSNSVLAAGGTIGKGWYMGKRDSLPEKINADVNYE